AWFDAVIAERAHDLFVDVGCAEGFYAVGMALRLPSLMVRAFDIDAAAQQMAKGLAQLNGVADRVQVCGACEHGGLQQLLSGANRPLLLVDI
ncbi:50S ribosomal protein L11 methyltransferase, partial [Mycobacterium tuberculosis]|nr:50S ribosomal protein L11 methyltransferase [Mycobacterium tuberculosis]